MTAPVPSTLVIDIKAAPPTATFTSHKRVVSLTATSAAGADVASAKAIYPVSLVDDSGKVWTLAKDDGVTAVYTG